MIPDLPLPREALVPPHSGGGGFGSWEHGGGAAIAAVSLPHSSTRQSASPVKARAAAQGSATSFGTVRAVVNHGPTTLEQAWPGAGCRRAAAE